MKKTFPCGHKGKGQFCHRCHQKELEQAKKDAGPITSGLEDEESLTYFNRYIAGDR